MNEKADLVKKEIEEIFKKHDVIGSVTIMSFNPKEHQMGMGKFLWMSSSWSPYRQKGDLLEYKKELGKEGSVMGLLIFKVFHKSYEEFLDFSKEYILRFKELIGFPKENEDSKNI